MNNLIQSRKVFPNFLIKFVLALASPKFFKNCCAYKSLSFSNNSKLLLFFSDKMQWSLVNIGKISVLIPL